MATIYRFIVQQKNTGQGKSSGRKNSSSSGSSKGTAKKGRDVAILGGSKGGVEHNRKLRAINPVLNKMTGGSWEKGMRLSRAGMGLVTKNTETGAIGISGTALAIIIAFTLQSLMKWSSRERAKADEQNAQNFKQLENGVGAVHGQYKMSVNFWTGRTTYNQNK